MEEFYPPIFDVDLMSLLFLNGTLNNCPSVFLVFRRQWVCFCPIRLWRMSLIWRGGRRSCGLLGRAAMTFFAPCWTVLLTLTSTWPTNMAAPVSEQSQHSPSSSFHSSRHDDIIGHKDSLWIFYPECMSCHLLKPSCDDVTGDSP